MNNDQIFKDRARVLDEGLAGRASTAGADALLAEIVRLERVPARRRFLPSPGRALLGLAAAAAAVAAITPAMLSGGMISVAPQPGTSVSTTVEPTARQILLAAAVAMEEAPASGDYWRTVTIGKSMLPDPTRSYVIETSRSFEAWMAERPGLQSWWIRQYLGAEPATPQDEADWRAAGAPTSWRYPRDMETGNLFAVPYRPLEAAEGERTAERLHGRWKGKAGDLMVELITWKEVRAIPGEPEKLRSYLEERISRQLAADPVPGTDVEKLTAQLLRQGCVDIISRLPASPGARASAYRILASLPGIRAEGEMTDPLGRRGQALAYQVEAEPGLFTRVRLIVDPGTGLPLAEVTTNTTELANGRQVEIRHSTSYQAIGWTGERPELPARRN
ncbi:CU044_5270 family protein [Planomonospora sp. ID67723]|uniref:CU044_5270 family protein n=1 Tax=Planomonospora sp. ID67723 TaxID=2738134 RepID=UPI0018C43EEB|nr:CU044_5270 family protein [Planomonospora sp. ID67723]MBG0831972.1 CU044_5270 family protein [Planomonospora sp. ID67723]